MHPGPKASREDPEGGVAKEGDLKRMLVFLSKEFPSFDVLAEIANAPPTVELGPINAATVTAEAEHPQTDEEDMGMSYEELGHFGRLRKMSRCGPVGMFRKLLVTWSHLAPGEVAAKVKRFFYYYSVNRHKMPTITPSYHAEAYSHDDIASICGNFYITRDGRDNFHGSTKSWLSNRTLTIKRITMTNE